MRFTALASGILALWGAAFAQSEADKPRFDVADVHPSAFGTRESGLYLHRNRLELHGVTMLQLIGRAYGVPEDKIFGGPNWLDTSKFDIVAQAQTPVNLQTLPPMLRALLEDRFQLKARHEDKPEAIFVLLPAKRAPLKESAGTGEPKCDKTNQDGYQVLTCQYATVADLAARLPGAAPNYFNHPVVDKTGLTAKYDIVLKWSGRGQIGAGDPDHPSISLFDYLEKQVGIKVQPDTRPAESFVIESVNEKPSPNPPGTVEKLPPPVTEFEVAEIRASKPDTQPKVDIKNGRIEALGLTMKDLLGVAYNLDDYMFADTDKWMDSDHFDVIAKTDPSATDGTLQAMLRTLLEQRFHVKSHYEDRPVEVWALTAPKGEGKLKKTAGVEHAGCTRTPKDGAFTYSCRNTTMQQFAAKLPNVGGAAGYVNEHPLVDLTGLEGSYDFDIVWSPPARTYARNPTRSGPGEAAQAPTGGLTIFEAVDKQLGLKLSVQKHPMSVMIFDHLDRTPSEN